MNPEVASAAQGGTVGMVILVIQLALYLFFAYCQFVLAKKMAIANAWMSFIPVLNLYILAKM